MCCVWPIFLLLGIPAGSAKMPDEWRDQDTAAADLPTPVAAQRKVKVPTWGRFFLEQIGTQNSSSSNLYHELKRQLSDDQISTIPGNYGRQRRKSPGNLWMPVSVTSSVFDPNSRHFISKRKVSASRLRSTVMPRSTDIFAVYKEACESISDYEQVKTALNDRMERVHVLPNTWVWTTRCRKVRIACTGAAPGIVTSCKQKKAWVQVFARKHPREPWAWNWIAVDSSCNCAIKVTTLEIIATT